MATIDCKNCATIFEGNFCPQCGQSAKIHHINATTFLHDIPHDILHIDKGFPHTFIQLLTKPGKMLEEYIEGKRVMHFRPFAYVIIMSAISTFTGHWIQSAIAYIYSKKGMHVTEHAQTFFSKYQSAFIFIMIPFAAVCTWLVFRKNRYNFWEHVLMNTYLAAQLNLLIIVSNIVVLIKFTITGNPNYNLTFFITGFMFYYAFTFSKLMYRQTDGWKLGLSLGLMCFLLATAYATGMSVSGIMTPWWGK